VASPSTAGTDGATEVTMAMFFGRVSRAILATSSTSVRTVTSLRRPSCPRVNDST